MRTIFVVERQDTITGALQRQLDPHRYKISQVDQRNAISALKRGDPYIVILDLSSVSPTRAAAISEAVMQTHGVPIIALVRGKWPEEELAGAAYLSVSSGAQWVAAKLDQVLHARSQAEMTANPHQRENEIICGHVHLNPAGRELTVGARVSHVTPKESRLLQELMTHPGLILTRGWLMRKVWDTEYTGDTRTLYVHVRWLREKVEDDPRAPSIIKTVRGVGYSFEAPT